MFTRFCGFSEHIHHGQRENHGFSPWSNVVFSMVSPHFPIVSVAFQVPTLSWRLMVDRGQGRDVRHQPVQDTGLQGLGSLENAKIASSWGIICILLYIG